MSQKQLLQEIQESDKKIVQEIQFTESFTEEDMQPLAQLSKKKQALVEDTKVVKKLLQERK